MLREQMISLQTLLLPPILFPCQCWENLSPSSSSRQVWALALNRSEDVAVSGGADSLINFWKVRIKSINQSIDRSIGQSVSQSINLNFCFVRNVFVFVVTLLGHRSVSISFKKPWFHSQPVAFL